MKFFPIMGDAYSVDDYLHFDLSVETSDYYMLNRDNLMSLKSYVADVKKSRNVQFLYGGYLETRALYTSTHFTGEARDIHLGVDVWSDEGTRLYAPCDMELHSMDYNDAELDYGYTLIFYISVLDCYLLLGHLSKSSLEGKTVGMKIYSSTFIAKLGTPAENGGWEPHVHIQLIKDLGDYQGDYPGVCAKVDLDFYKNNCPDPSAMIVSSL